MLNSNEKDQDEPQKGLKVNEFHSNLRGRKSLLA